MVFAEARENMAKVVQSPPKSYPHEWKLSNQSQYLTAEAERSASERLRDETERVIEATDARTRKAQADVERNLSKRITDIEFWKDEVHRKIEEAGDEIASLQGSKEQLEFALQCIVTPMQVAQTCTGHRQGRKGIDLVHDDVEIQLMKVGLTCSRLEQTQQKQVIYTCTDMLHIVVCM